MVVDFIPHEPSINTIAAEINKAEIIFFKYIGNKFAGKNTKIKPNGSLKFLILLIISSNYLIANVSTIPGSINFAFFKV